MVFQLVHRHSLKGMPTTAVIAGLSIIIILCQICPLALTKTGYVNLPME